MTMKSWRTETHPWRLVERSSVMLQYYGETSLFTGCNYRRTEINRPKSIRDLCRETRRRRRADGYRLSSIDHEYSRSMPGNAPEETSQKRNGIVSCFPYQSSSRSSKSTSSPSKNKSFSTLSATASTPTTAAAPSIPSLDDFSSPSFSRTASFATISASPS